MVVLGTILVGGFFIAMFVGLLTGIFGVGGGFLMTPALIIILGVPGGTAVGTGLATILVTSSFAVLGRRRTGTVDVKLGLTIAGGGVLGVAVGFSALEWLKRAEPIVINGREIDTVKYVLLCAFGVLLALIAGYLWLDYRRTGGRPPEKRVGLLARVKLPPYGCYRSLEEPRLSVIALVLLGMSVGILTGLMGVGGGIILLPALIYLVGQRVVRAAGTSLLIVWLSSLIAAVLNSGFGNIDVQLWVIMTLGGLIGVHFGTKIGLKATEPGLHLHFIYVVAAGLLLIGYKVVSMTFFGGVTGG